MLYTDIQGWFAEEEFYSRMVAQAPANAVFVEIGCWLGKSTCYLARAIQESGKQIALHAVDTWMGSPNEPELVAEVARCGGSVFDVFMANMDAAGVRGIIKPIAGPSLGAAAMFEPRTLDFVFIDADHSYAAVRADILAWLPLVKRGGTLAGHDWNTYPDVRRAVTELLGKRFAVEGNCWVHQVP